MEATTGRSAAFGFAGIGSVGLFVLLSVLAPSACSPGNDPSVYGDGGSGSESSADSSGSLSGDFTGGGSNGSNSNGSGGGCAGTTVKAQKLPLDMYIMFDQSGSMAQGTDGGVTKWSAVTNALSAFVDQPEAAGIGVGLQYFPLPKSGAVMCPTECMADADCGMCGPCFGFLPGFPGFCIGGDGEDDSCVAADYAKPEVEIAVLPGVAPAIKDSMKQHGPTGGTPTYPALQGAVDHAKEWALKHPDHVVIALLATDGNPASCEDDLGKINAIAAAGASGTPKVATFVIGVGESIDALDGIAKAGGSEHAFLVDGAADVQQQFLDALEEIQGTALGCVYSIPVPETGTPDLSSVNVEYTPGNGADAKTLPKVDNANACPEGGNAWYYDNANSPTQILFCEGICGEVKADAMGSLDIVLGCATILN